MLLAGRQFRIFAVAHSFNRSLARNGVLHARFNAGNPADSIGMALAYAFAPEGIFLALRQNRLRKKTIQ
ncbi:hypothetical protein D3C78_1775950 [compost metagenome]